MVKRSVLRTLQLVGVSYGIRTQEKESKTMDTKQQTCEQRIEAELERLEESTAEILDGFYYKDEDGFEEWNNYPLAVTTRKQTKIELSWGGPSDFLLVNHDGAEIYSVEYHFQDWFDGARRDVAEGSKVWEYCKTVIETREECGY